MIGFTKIRESLRGASKRGTLAHSHILTGPDGIGKAPLAKALAHLILDPDCDSDRDFVDITKVRPEGKSIGVDDVRKIVSEANIMPFAGKRKVIIIYQAELMTHQAQNALLKTVEEPLPGVYFIILTRTIDDLLPTIRSRCALHRLAPLGKEEIRDYIREVHGLKGEELEWVAAISMGIPGKVDDFIRDPAVKKFYDDVVECLADLAEVKTLRDRSCLKILGRNQKILGFGPERYLEAFTAAVRDLACIKAATDYKSVIFLYNVKRLETLSGKYTMMRLGRIVEVCESARRLLEPGRNINRETVVDSTLFKLVEET